MTTSSSKLPALIAVLALFLGGSGAAIAQPQQLRIASGEIGGTYRDVYAPGLGRLLSGYKVLHRSTSGSGENLDLLASGQVDLGFAQADVYAARLAADAGRYANLVVVGKLADECIYVAHRKQGRVTTWAQLVGNEATAGRPLTVATGPEGSGSRGTWGYLTTIAPGLASVELNAGEGTLALNQLAAGAYDAVVWVTDPTNFDHHSLRAVLSSDALDLMPLADPGLTRSLPDGTTVYGPRDVALGSGWRAPSVATICTSALVFARKDADARLLRNAADAIALKLRDIVPSNR